LSKIGIHHVWSWNASTTNNYNILVPLQIVDIIETLKNLHHKLLAEIVNILTMRYIFFLFFAQSLMASPKRKVFKLSPNPNVQLVVFTTWISWMTRWRNIIHPLHPLKSQLQKVLPMQNTQKINVARGCWMLV